MKRQWQTVWKVAVGVVPSADGEEEPEETPEYTFTNERAAKSFARAVEAHAAWVVGPWESSIYRTAKLALIERDRGT